MGLPFGLTRLPLTSNRVSCNSKVPDEVTNDVVLRRLWGSGFDSCDQMAEVGRWDFGRDPWDGCIFFQGKDSKMWKWNGRTIRPRDKTK